MREKLLELIKKNPTCIEMGANSCSDCQYGSFEDCRSECLADHLTANDAVLVVRCKDCKHYEDYKRKVYENCVRNDRFVPMKPDDFCSYGERRTK